LCQGEASASGPCWIASLVVGPRFRRRKPHADVPAYLRIEAVAGQQRVGTLTARARIFDAQERGSALAEQPFGGKLVCTRSNPNVGGVIAGRRIVSRRQDGSHDLAIDALATQLLRESVRATGPSPISRLHPGPREGRVVEHPKLEQPADRGFYERRRKPGGSEVAPYLLD
jgi:hypothetical protein